MKVAIVMGSITDRPILEKGLKLLKDFDVEVEMRVISAHRTPEAARKFALEAEENGIKVIIAAAGMAAHLAGVLAAFTTLPIIGIPLKSDTLDGLDALLSTVQMPRGIPVATVAINGAENAALLACNILALTDSDMKEKVLKYREGMTSDIVKIDKELQESME